MSEAALLGVSASLLISACGGSRQNAHEEKRAYDVEVVHVTFPSRQSIARPASLELRVRNAGTHTAPNVAVTLDSFYYTATFPHLAANKRPIWVVETGPGAVPARPVQSVEISPPGGGQTAYVNTWALGPLGPGQTHTFLWKVAPVKSGRYTVHYRVAAGLAGNASAQTAGGAPVQGQLTASIAAQPPATHVDPATGRVVEGAYPLVP